jgi:hypothetical protein
VDDEIGPLESDQPLDRAGVAQIEIPPLHARAAPVAGGVARGANEQPGRLGDQQIGQMTPGESVHPGDQNPHETPLIDRIRRL